MASDESVKKASKKLLGQSLRLGVAAAVARAEPDDLYPDALARDTGLDRTRVGEQLAHFADAGVLRTLPMEGRKQPYERIETAYWELCSQLYDEVVGGLLADDS